MKIVCDACQAKYSISDDKVQGKVFKIRCKKCSNIIVVRGGAGAAEPAPAPQQEKDTRVYDYGYEGGDHAPAGDEAVWHVVINQDQVGPMTAVDVQQRFAAGEIDSETYVWREGFADWLPMAQVDTFTSLVASGASAAAPAAARAGGAEAVASMFGDEAPGRSDPGDLFATASAGGARNDDDGSDLFGSKPSGSQPTAGPRLRGERNENSVLFSLNNLAQLASDKPTPAATHAVAATASSASSPSGGEGSGLIDIRSMASAYLGGGTGTTAKPASAGIGSIDDLPVFGGGGFSEPAVIVPITARPNSNKLMYALIGSVGLLVVAAAIVVIVLLRGGSSTPSPTAIAAADKIPAPPTDKAAVAPPADTKPSESAPPTTPATTPSPPEAKGTDTSGDKPRDTKATDTPSNPSDTKHAAAPPVHKASPPPSTATTTAPPTPRPKLADKPPPPPVAKEPPPPPKDTSKGDSCDEVSCVLNNYEGACCAKFKRGGAKPSSGGTGGSKGGDVPESLDRAMISEGVAKVKARVMSCGEKSPAKGQVKVSVKVSPDGQVTNVTVKNTPDANLGNCVQSMMQKATFARTQTGGSFSYPYTF